MGHMDQFETYKVLDSVGSRQLTANAIRTKVSLYVPTTKLIRPTTPINFPVYKSKRGLKLLPITPRTATLRKTNCHQITNLIPEIIPGYLLKSQHIANIFAVLDWNPVQRKFKRWLPTLVVRRPRRVQSSLRPNEFRRWHLRRQ